MSLFDSSKGCLTPIWIDQVGLLPCGRCVVCKEKRKEKRKEKNCIGKAREENLTNVDIF